MVCAPALICAVPPNDWTSTDPPVIVIDWVWPLSEAKPPFCAVTASPAASMYCVPNVDSAAAIPGDPPSTSSVPETSTSIPLAAETFPVTRKSEPGPVVVTDSAPGRIDVALHVSAPAFVTVALLPLRPLTCNAPALLSNTSPPLVALNTETWFGPPRSVAPPELVVSVFAVIQTFDASLITPPAVNVTLSDVRMVVA